MKRPAGPHGRDWRRSSIIVTTVWSAAIAAACETSSTITQAPTPVKCQVTLAAPPMLDADGGSGTLSIDTAAECAWDVSTTAEWITGLSPASGQGAGNVSFRVAENDSPSPRDGVIVVNGEQVRVSQRAGCQFDVGPSSLSMPAAGGSGRITVTAPNECTWTASTDAEWIALSSSPGSGNGVVGFKLARNEGEARSGVIAVGNRHSTISQAGVSASSCAATIAPASHTIPAAGGSGAVAVTAGNACRWTASSNASWITITSGAAGSGNGRVGYLALANIGGSRTGTLTIAGQTFTLTQSALLCTFSVSPGKQRVEAEAGSGTFSVSTGGGCSWTTQSNAPWLTITSGAGGTGDGTVSFSYAANTDDRDRKGTLTIAGRTVEVEQKKPKGKGKGDDNDNEEEDD